MYCRRTHSRLFTLLFVILIGMFSWLSPHFALPMVQASSPSVAPASTGRNITVPFDWYRYQGSTESGSCAGHNCGPTTVAMAIQFAKNNQGSLPTIKDVRNYLGFCGSTGVRHFSDALEHWNVRHKNIAYGDMEAIREAVNARGHIVIVTLDMRYTTEGDDWNTAFSSPDNRDGTFYRKADNQTRVGGHAVVVKGFSPDNKWVITYDPNVWGSNRDKYSDRTWKGIDRYYAYDEFAQGFQALRDGAIEILDAPAGHTTRDYNGDGVPDLYTIDKEGKGTNSTELHILDGANKYQKWLLRTGTPQHQTGRTGEWAFALADYNGDGVPDLYTIDKEGKGTDSTELHILDGASKYQKWLLHTGTPQHQTGRNGEWAFALADYNGDGVPDLYTIDKEGKGTDSTELHILDGANKYQKWLLRTGTPQHQTGRTGEWAFALADYNGDGKPDLYTIDKEGQGTNSTELHILDGASKYQKWLLHTGTPQHRTGLTNEWAFILADYNGDGKPDLYTIDKEGKGTNSTEVHILDGANKYQKWLLHTGTPQHRTGTDCEWDFATGGDCVANIWPNAPIPLSPAHDETVELENITLSWKSRGDPDLYPGENLTYQVRIWPDGETQETPWFQSDWIQATSLSISVPVSGVYWWNVQANDGMNTSDWSEARRIFIQPSSNDPIFESNFKTGNPGSTFIFTATDFPSDAEATISIKEPDAANYRDIAKMPLSSVGDVVFVLYIPENAQEGMYTVRITVQGAATILAEHLVQEVTLTIEDGQPQRNDNPAETVPIISPDTDLVTRTQVYLPLLAR